MSRHLTCNILIFGGGIAGLWTLARLKQLGISALLVESSAIGQGQTLASQGIIHGGTKYALSGRLSEAARAIGEMPQRWRDCLAGAGELDLSDVRLLAEYQWLWSPGDLGSRLAGFFAGKAMRSRLQAAQHSEFPPPFDASEFGGRLYRLDEPVLDVPSLIDNLYRQCSDSCIGIDANSVVFDEGDDLIRLVTSAGTELAIECRQVVFAAGEGNGKLLERAGLSQPVQQLRPLHMVMAEGELPPVYAHCLGHGMTPRVTITSHSGTGGTVWYLGGQLAEQGVARDEAAQLESARHLLSELLPWLDFSKLCWRTLRINRAEPQMPDGSRPDSCFVSDIGRFIIGWPTKLAFAPRFADEVIQRLHQRDTVSNDARPGAGERPQAGRPPWLRSEYAKT